MSKISFQQKFRDYNVQPFDIGFMNIGWKYVFPNGYGASVIDDGYRSKDKSYEIAVLKKITDNEYSLCYDTPITDDVLGYLDNDEVIEILEKIKNLKG